MKNISFHVRNSEGGWVY